MKHGFLSMCAWLAVALSVGAAVFTAHAQPTSTGTMNLQGRITGVADGTRDMTLFLHDAESGGVQVASVGPVPTVVSGGLFSANFAVGPSVFDGRTLWWSVGVDGGPETSRQMITSVPYATTASRLASTEAEMFLVAETIRCDGSFKATTHSPSRYAVEILNQGGIGGLVVATQPGGGLPLMPFSVTYAGQPRFSVFADGTTDNFGFFRSQANSAGRYSLEATNASGAGGLIVSTSQGGGLHPLVVLFNGQQLFSVLQNGRTEMRVLSITGGADLAEHFAVSPAESTELAPKPGMVLSIDPDHPGALRVATDAYDTRVAGVYSGGNGLPTGMIMGKQGCVLTAPGEDKLPLAMTGRVWVYADESNGVITPGDRLTTSGHKPGHAMKATEAARADGAVIGKAMTGVDAKTGMVLVLVNLQ